MFEIYINGEYWDTVDNEDYMHEVVEDLLIGGETSYNQVQVYMIFTDGRVLVVKREHYK